MRKTEFTIYLDIKSTINSPDYKKFQYDAIDELCKEANSLTIPIEYYGDTRFRIKKILKDDIEKESLLKEIQTKNIYGISNTKDFLKNELLKFNCEITVPNTIPQKIKDSWSDEDKEIFGEMDEEEFNLSYIYEIIKKRVNDLLFALNLAKVGALSVNKYLIFQDDNKNIMGGKNFDYKSFYNAKLKGIYWGYPQISEMSIKKTWEWLISFNDYLLGFSNCSTSRALINLCEISREDENMKLFRAVMGLEAIYTKGNGNLQEQVRQKSQAVLGEQQKFKKLYNNMYNIRSKFIHGELNFVSRNHLDISNKSVEYNENLRDSIDFAILILIASIQELIKRGWQGYNFSYIVDNQTL